MNDPRSSINLQAIARQVMQAQVSSRIFLPKLKNNWRTSRLIRRN